MTPVYLDHAATTPMSESALAAYVDALGRTGNPSSLHSAGRAARRMVEESREQIAAAVGSLPSEVVFTAGGTEADNLAIKGGYWARNTATAQRRRILVSAVEHHAVLDPAFWMAEHAGAEIVLLPVDQWGRVDLQALRDELETHGDQVALCSVMWANNEVGTVQSIRDVVSLARRSGVPVHSDAVQALGSETVNFDASGLSGMTITAHKVGGPVGVGALIARRDFEMTALLSGGGQERGVRSGTIDAAAIRAFAVALTETVEHRSAEAKRLASLRDDLIAGVRASIPGATLRGPDPTDDPAGRLATNAHFTFSGCEGDSLLYVLDSAGVCASTGSACQAGVPQASHVLVAMGISETDARGALRFSLGAQSSSQDVAKLLEVLPGAVERARAAGVAMLSGATRVAPIARGATPALVTAMTDSAARPEVGQPRAVLPAQSEAVAR